MKRLFNRTIIAEEEVKSIEAPEMLQGNFSEIELVEILKNENQTLFPGNSSQQNQNTG